MQISNEVAAKYWIEAAMEEVSAKYRSEGYEVTKEAQIGDFRADLVARKGDELIVVAFKSGHWSDRKSEEVRRIRNEVVHRLGGEFNFVVVSSPKDIDIEIEDIEYILLDIIMNDLGDLDELSTHTYVKDVSDVVIISINIEQNKIHVQGSGVVSVELNWGSSADHANGHGLTEFDSFPFDFDIVLDGNLKLLQVERIRFDTSSFYA
jgi:hypothetical protein